MLHVNEIRIDKDYHFDDILFAPPAAITLVIRVAFALPLLFGFSVLALFERSLAMRPSFLRSGIIQTGRRRLSEAFKLDYLVFPSGPSLAAAISYGWASAKKSFNL
jgi:hypothetical protein